MKNKRINAFLSIMLFILMLAFFAFAHIITAETVGILSFLTDTFKSIWNFLLEPVFSVPYIATVSGFVLILVLLLTWVIRLLVHRRHFVNLLSPLLFLAAVGIGIIIVDSRFELEDFFNTGSTKIATVYLLVTGFAVIALSIHLLFVGIATASNSPKESLLKEVVVEKVVEPSLIAVEPVEEVVVTEAVGAKVAPEVVVVKEKEVHNEDKIRAIVQEVLKEELKDRKLTKEKTPPPIEAKEPVKKVEPVEKKVVVPTTKVLTPQTEEETVAARIPFAERMLIVEDSVKEDYNELKNYMLSFGLKSRVSNSGDSFRLGRKLYAKLTNSGNTGLKLYLPIDMNDYQDSKIPLKDASGIKQYQDVPTFIYIKSDLSIKRAQLLFDDLMLKEGIMRKFDYVVEDFMKEFEN